MAKAPFLRGFRVCGHSWTYECDNRSDNERKTVAIASSFVVRGTATNRGSRRHAAVIYAKRWGKCWGCSPMRTQRGTGNL